MKIEDFRLISNELNNINFSAKRAKVEKVSRLTGEFAVANLSEQEDIKFGIKTSIKIVERGKDLEEELSELEIEYMSTFTIDNCSIDDLLNNNEEFDELMPDIINKFIYPDILQYLESTYNNAKIKSKLPKKLSIGGGK